MTRSAPVACSFRWNTRIRYGSSRTPWRYHDAIPMTQADTAHWRSAMLHHHMTNLCAHDSIFVCNSPMSDDLDHVAPGAGGRAVVIPCAIQPPIPITHPISVQDILLRRISFAALGMEPHQPQSLTVRRTVERQLRQQKALRYIICVSTIEPRKNYPGLIAAWERMRLATGKDIKLVIVGQYGWSTEQSLAAMRPNVLAGNLIHVDKVPTDELQVLYQNAEFCAFMPFAEGFGYCPWKRCRWERWLSSPIFRSCAGRSAMPDCLLIPTARRQWPTPCGACSTPQKIAKRARSSSIRQRRSRNGSLSVRSPASGVLSCTRSARSVAPKNSKLRPPRWLPRWPMGDVAKLADAFKARGHAPTTATAGPVATSSLVWSSKAVGG
jgi:hypothetical protein